MADIYVTRQNEGDPIESREQQKKGCSLTENQDQDSDLNNNNNLIF